MSTAKESSVFYTTFFPSLTHSFDDIIKKTRNINEDKVTLQLVDPKIIVSDRQIQVAIYHTLKSFRSKNNIARDLATEFLIRLSGEKQISKALDIYGIKETSEYWMLIAFGESKLTTEEVAMNFLEEIDITVEQIKEISLPLMSVKELSQLYNCEEDRDEIEKKVLEKMAAVTLL